MTNLNNNDYVEISSESEDNNNNNNNENKFVVKKSVLYKNNLYHSINLMKILKENKNLTSFNNNNNSDESNNSIIEYKKEKNLIDLSIAKILKDEKPKFLKSKLNLKTNQKFNGISGKYFGC